jgi:hypothetical protein
MFRRKPAPDLIGGGRRFADIGERSDAVLRTAIGERSDAVLRTAMNMRHLDA